MTEHSGVGTKMEHLALVGRYLKNTMIDNMTKCCVNTINNLFFGMSMHNRIAVFRAEYGISRATLADAVGVNPQTIGYLERGDYTPSLELAMKIARHFGVTVEMLFSFERFEPIAVTLRRND